MELIDREWKGFYIGELFEVKRPSARSEKKYNSGKYPFVASGNLNNGVICYCSKKECERLDKGNCITISPVDGSAFYQISDFLGRGGAGSSVLLLYNEKINRYSGLYISKALRQTCSKYSYGKMGNQDGIKRELIMLPVDDSGNPDYLFMEEYVREEEKHKKDKYIVYAKKQLEALQYKEIQLLDEKEWKEFFIKEVFVEVQRGKRLTKSNQGKGDKPYVSSSAMNNGVDNYICNDKNVRTFSDCISIANSGSVGSSFYQPFEFIASDHVTHLKNSDFNKYIYFFIATLCCRLSSKYNFNREINDKRISKEKILLPINEHGTPDYEFMEQYAKNLIVMKLKTYLAFAMKK